MHDTVYQRMRMSISNVNEPLLRIIDEHEMLLGKPIYICPDLPALSGGSVPTNSTVVFGDATFTSG
jgi:hypothetical protein